LAPRLGGTENCKHDVQEWVELINDLNPGRTVHSTYMSSIRLLFVTETLADVQNSQPKGGGKRARTQKDWQARFTTIIGSKPMRDIRKQISVTD